MYIDAFDPGVGYVQAYSPEAAKLTNEIASVRRDMSAGKISRSEGESKIAKLTVLLQGAKNSAKASAVRVKSGDEDFKLEKKSELGEKEPVDKNPAKEGLAIDFQNQQAINNKIRLGLA